MEAVGRLGAYGGCKFPCGEAVRSGIGGGPGVQSQEARRVYSPSSGCNDLGDHHAPCGVVLNRGYQREDGDFGHLEGLSGQAVEASMQEGCPWYLRVGVLPWRQGTNRSRSRRAIVARHSIKKLADKAQGNLLAANFRLMLIEQTLLSACRSLMVKPLTKTISMGTLWERFLYSGSQIVGRGRIIYLDMARTSPGVAHFLALWQQMDALKIHP